MGKRNRGSASSPSACKLLHSGFDANMFIADAKRTLSSFGPYEPWAGWFWWRTCWHSSAIHAARAVVHLRSAGGAAGWGQASTGSVGRRCSQAAGELKWEY